MSAPTLARREAVKLIAAAAAATSAAGAAWTVLAAEPTPGADLRPNRPARPAGTFSDPNLVAPDLSWPRILAPEQLTLIAVLGDLIIPADDHSPAASAIGAADFVDEWVSAPFPAMEDDRETLLAGLAWIDAAARSGHDRPFVDLAEAEQTAICDRICGAEPATDETRPGVEGFDLLRRLVAAAFYTTPAGLQDLQYLGNTPQDSWGPPPEAALRHVGLL